MWLIDKLQMALASRMVGKAERDYVDICQEERQAVSEKTIEKYEFNGLSIARQTAALIIASYMMREKNDYYFARKAYYQARHRLTRNPEKRRRISHKISQTPDPVVAVSVADVNDLFLCG
jgi:ABC-type transporter lipoprotein component MlaA